MNDGGKGEEVAAATTRGAGFSKGFWCVLTVIGLLVCAGLFLFSSTRSCGRGDFNVRTAIDARSLQTAIRQYRATYGVYPTGDGPSVSRALLGDNPQRESFLDWSPRPDSPTQELPDPWGTPYRIYFSGDDILVRSAGPNRQFDDSSSYGNDDLIYGTHRR